MKENIFNYLPLKAYRYLRWRRSANREYRYHRRYFSREYARICLEAAKASWQNRSTDHILAAYAKKDAYIMAYLENLCGDVIEKYKNAELPQNVRDDERKIWVFWWTGEESAPDIVKACIKSIRRNANGRQVVMLDRDTYRDYVTFPEYILEKHENGQITHAAFADLLRLNLLATHGGIWIDATVFLSQPLPEQLFIDKFYTLKTVDLNAAYFSKSRWCGYFLAGSSSFLLYSFAKDFMLTYWERQDEIIEYLLMDYVFGIACKHFPEVGRAIEALPDNNTMRARLMNAINEPYSAELFAMLAGEDTFASKLSWRYGDPQPHNGDGQLTNYGHLLTL